MEEWKEYKLGDVCELIPGFAFKSKDFGNYVTKVIKIKDIQPPFVDIEGADGVCLLNYDVSKLSKFLIHKGDFILAMTGATIGKIGRYVDNTPSYLNQRVLKFSPKSFVDFNYIYYYLSNPIFHSYVLNHVDSESAQPNISAKTIGKYPVLLPSLEEQKSISSILRSLDDKIEINRRINDNFNYSLLLEFLVIWLLYIQINDNLEQQAQALFKSWFVDFEPFKDGEFVESELGMIPKGWRVGTLNELGDIVGGSTPSKTKSEYYTNNGIAWLTPKDLSISQRKFTSKGEIDITPEGYESCSTKLMPRGTVVFSSRAPIGYITIAKNDICTNQGFKSVIPTFAGTAFLYCFLKESTLEIENKATGSTFKEVSGSLMKSLSAIIPEKSVLEDFENLLNPIFHQQEVFEEESSLLSSLRDSLLPRLLSGELNLDNINK